MATDRTGLVVALVACLAVGCNGASGDDSAALSPGPSGSGNASGNAAPGGNVGTGTASGGAAALPPEKELDQSFRAPVATGHVLWTANPDSGRVALIDADTLKVRMTNAGFGPTYLAAVPSAAGTDSAIVLNVGSHDASWLQAGSDSGPISVTNIPTSADLNAWSVSDDGHFAIAWADATQIQGAPDLVDGFSEITVIDLGASPPEPTRLSVGFRPSRIVFDAQKLHAYAVVDEGITVIDLSGSPRVSKLIPVATGVGGGSAGAASTRDINIAPNGSFAVVRVDGSAEVKIFDLVADTQQTITLESDPTDLDLSADGKTATAVLGNQPTPTVVSFAVPKPATGPSAFVSVPITGQLVRSVTLAPDGKVAVLYVNAVANDFVTLLNTALPSHPTLRTLDLKSPVQQVFVAPDSATAITFQLPPAGSKYKGIFSIVPTEAVVSARIVDTDATPGDVAFSNSTLGKALVTVHDSASAVRGAYLVGLANLDQTFIPLASEPLPGAAGIVPGVAKGFVAQRHPEGRITFIDLETGTAQTLTGFELAARVVQ